MLGIEETPEPPYYAVIFTSSRKGDDPAYGQMAEEMEHLARAHPGCLGMESAREPDGVGITVSYWKDEDSIADWKADARHLVAQRLGAKEWYSAYATRVARVERAYQRTRSPRSG